MKNNMRQRGNIGEDLAVIYLEERGYTIIERNVSIQGGEMDIICIKSDEWHCVEVKFRGNTLFGYPEEAMTPRKIQTLLRAIDTYCIKKDISRDLFHLDFLGILEENGKYEYTFISDIESS